MNKYTQRFWFGFAAPVLAMFAVMFSLIGSFFCETVKFSPTGEWVGTVDFTPTDVQLSPWSQKDTVLVSRTDLSGDTYYFVRDICVNFSGQVDIDSKWKAVRAFSIMTPIIGGFVSFFILLTNCTYYLSASTWKNVMILFGVFLPIFQGLSFLLLNSNACAINPLLSSNPSPETVTNDTWVEWINLLYPEECSWDVGMTMNVVATVFYFLTACCMLYTGVPTRPPQPPPETQEVTYERKVGPDGTVTVAQTNVVKGTAVPAVTETTATVAGTTEQPV